MVLLLVACPGPGDIVPAPDDVHDGGEARGHADAEAESQQVIVATESEGQNVSNTIQTPGDQIETFILHYYAMNVMNKKIFFIFTDVNNIFLSSPPRIYSVQSHCGDLLVLRFEKEKNVQIPSRNDGKM